LSFLDVLGIGLVGPYLSLVVDNSNQRSAILNWFFERNLAESSDKVLIMLGLLLVLVFVVKGIASILINRKIFIFGNSQVVSIRTRLMEIYQNMPYTDHIKRNSSEYIQATQGYSVQLIGVIIVLSKWVCEGIAVISIFAILTYSQGFIPILLILFIVAFVYLYNFIFSSTVKKAGKIAPIQNSLAIKGISESMEGFKEIKIFGIESFFTKKVQKASQIFSEQRCKEQIISFAPRQIIESIMVVFIVSLVIGSLLWGDDKNVLPILGMLGVATARLLPSATILTKGLTTLQFSRYGISVLFNDIKKYSTNKKEKLSVLNSTIEHNEFHNFELVNIFYKYPNSKENILSNINFKIKQNESIGLIGSSGAGKTTMLDLILGLLVPNQGAINYNGSPLKYNLAAWRSNIAYIPQQIFLIDDTLRRNIALGVEDSVIDEKKIMEAIKLSQLSNLINELPKGINTFLGERGVRLSGGQRQRVALARAFYHGREVLVMDEATSALDTKIESQIVEAINKFKKNKTIIVIAHRLSTVRTCDVIYKIEKGNIVGFGPPEKMLKREIDYT